MRKIGVNHASHQNPPAMIPERGNLSPRALAPSHLTRLGKVESVELLPAGMSVRDVSGLESPGEQLAREIRSRRLAAGHSHASLAALVGYTRQYLSIAERPSKGLASVELVRALDRALEADGELIALRAKATAQRQALRSRSSVAEMDTSVCTGWSLQQQTPVAYQVAICGSRASGTDGAVIDDVVRAFGSFLTTHRCRIQHGPVGIGIEVMTYVADHYRPPGLNRITGVFGHLNVVRDADYVLVVGGGAGTQAEIDIAFSMTKKVLPMAAAGGAAARAHDLMTREPPLRAWITEEEWQQLGIDTTGRGFVRALQSVLTSRGAGE